MVQKRIFSLNAQMTSKTSSSVVMMRMVNGRQVESSVSKRSIEVAFGNVVQHDRHEMGSQCGGLRKEELGGLKTLCIQIMEK